MPGDPGASGAAAVTNDGRGGRVPGDRGLRGAAGAARGSVLTRGKIW